MRARGASPGAPRAPRPRPARLNPPRTPTRRKRLPPTPSLPTLPTTPARCASSSRRRRRGAVVSLPTRRASASATRSAPHPPPRARGLIGQFPRPLRHPRPRQRARRVAAEEAARVFSSEAGVPVFVGRPPADVTCRVCRDVFLDPVIADDGFTYCRRCVPSATADDHPGALGAEHLAPDHEARAKVAASLVLCRNGLKILDNADGVNRWVYDPEGCVESVPYESRAAHEDECGYARAACGLPGTGRGVDCCPAIVLRRERASHRAACPYRLAPCPVPGCGRTVQHNRKAQHVSGCEFRTAECPNGCGWRGRRGEVTNHRSRCGLETTTCAREDSENRRRRARFARSDDLWRVRDRVRVPAVACAHCGGA